MDTILEVSHLSKDFYPPLVFSQLLRLNFKQRKPVHALRDISFSLPKGRVLGILGPNGAGKTTLLKILSTLILPDKGTVSVHGLTLGKDEEKIKACVGLVLDEERSFYWRLTGRQNLEFFGTLFGLDKVSLGSRINELLELFEIEYADKRFDSYSTGMRRRLALTRAVLHDPALLLLDEPTKSLDFTSSLNLRKFIKESLVRSQGKTAIFTTHVMEEASGLADFFMVLNQGRLCGWGTLEELREKIDRPRASLSEIFLGLTGGRH
jgi:ABC-2 type transport system ATP-binding protein